MTYIIYGFHLIYFLAMRNPMIFFLLLVISFSCFEELPLDEPLKYGSLSVFVDIEEENIINSRTEELDISDFDVFVINDDQDTTHSWNTTTDIPDTIILEADKYVVVIESDTYDLPAFDAKYYRGVSDTFTIIDGKNTLVEVTIRLANVKVTVDYTDSVKNDFYDYFVRVTDSQSNFLTFSKGEVRPGFFMEGDLILYTKLFFVDQNSDSVFIEKTTIVENALNNDHIKILVDANLTLGTGIISILTELNNNTRNLLISFNDVDIDSGLVAYYPFNGDALDKGQYGFDGTVVGANLTSDKDDLEDQAFQFDGIDDYISTSTEIDQLLGDGFTFAAWINLAKLDQETYHTVFSNYNGNSPTGNCNTRIGFHFSIKEDGALRIFYAWDGNDRYGRDTNVNLIQVNTWYHVVTCWDGNIAPSGFKLYINAERVDEFDYSEGFFNCGGFLESLDSIRIGINECGISESLCHPFNGIIDEVRIYNRQLNADEIEALAQL